MTAAAFWWAFTLGASIAQTFRNAMQRELIGALGAVGAAEVRFLFGLPFAILFVVVVRLFSGESLPALTAPALAWTVVGGVAQIVATAMMLAAMRSKSFVVVIAATKTEPAQVALIALIAFGEEPSATLIAAIALATFGVWLMSGVRGPSGDWRALALGVFSASFFALAAIAFRAAVLDVAGGSFVIRASFVLALSLAIQTAILFVYLGAFDRKAVVAILAAWRPSLFAGFMGAFASQLWFISFALSDAARVRTLALVEAPLALIVSARLFKERPSLRELIGIAMIVVAAASLVSGATL